MNDTICILKELIRIDSSNPPGSEKNMVDYIITHFQGYENLKIINHGENRASMMIEIAGKSEDVVAVVGHMDTVPAPNPSNWKYKPFEAVAEGSNIHGRGASDMKSGLACMISIAKDIISNGIKPSNTLRFIFTADEECNGAGIGSFIDYGYFNDVKYLLIPEPTGDSLIIKEKGALWLKLKVNGKSSHGSAPELGINAIEKLYELVQNLRALIDDGQRDELLGKSSFALNKISGGIKTNVTADYCEAEIDIRTIPLHSHDTLLNGINALIEKIEAKYVGLRVELEILNNRIPMETAESNELVTKIKGVMKSFEYDINVKGANFFTDGSLVLSKHDIPFVIYGPGLINQCHVDNEYLPLDTLERALNVYRKLLK